MIVERICRYPSKNNMIVKGEEILNPITKEPLSFTCDYSINCDVSDCKFNSTGLKFRQNDGIEYAVNF